MVRKQTNPESLTHKTGEDAIAAAAAKQAAKPRKASAKKASAKKASPKRSAKARRGGGKALRDFTNTAKIKVLKAKELARKDCFRNGQTVEQNLAAQKKAGFRGRRKYIRKQIALKRIALS